MDQSPAVALTAFADEWPRAIEPEIGAALCAIGCGKRLLLDLRGRTCLLCPWVDAYKQYFYFSLVRFSENLLVLNKTSLLR